MKARSLVAVLALIASLSLPACNLIQSERVSLCQEAMEMNANQLKAGEAGRKKFILGCRTNANIYTSDQWKCITNEMKHGKAYVEATNTCAPK